MTDHYARAQQYGLATEYFCSVSRRFLTVIIHTAMSIDAVVLLPVKYVGFLDPTYFSYTENSYTCGNRTSGRASSLEGYLVLGPTLTLCTLQQAHT